MPVTVVVGAQYGGEGKGKVTAHLCRNYRFDVAVRCGGPNSGHTTTINGEQVVLRQIPAGVVNPDTRLLLSAGCLIDLEVLGKEIEFFNLTPSRLRIDPNAVIIDEEFSQEEKRLDLSKRIGSTCTGTGIAVAKRVLRDKDVKLVKDIHELKPYISNIPEEIMTAHLSRKNIVIEGTQGFGLSVYHSHYYPYTTSRDTTASGFLSEVGISPKTVTDIILVMRTFPIRVGGNSGPLPNEITWEIVQNESCYPYEIREFTTVTKTLRRVARFDNEIVKKAVIANMPTQIALMGVDYLDFKNKGVENYHDLKYKARDFILLMERDFKTSICYIGTGPTDFEIIDRLEEWKNEPGKSEAIKAI